MDELSAPNDTVKPREVVQRSDESDLYAVAVPVILSACLLSVAFNLLILCSVRWVRRALSPTLCFSLSLAVADAYASTVVAIGLVLNSLLPFVYGIELGPFHMCYIFVLEAFRLAGLIASVLHLLALAVNHYLGILRPLHYAATVTRRTAGFTIALLWIVPIAFFFVYFSSVPDEGFQSDHCQQHSFMTHSPFRLTVFTLFFAPLVLMTAMYVHIFFVVQQHQRGLIQFPSARSFHRNVKALVTTLLILGTYVIGWMPALLFFVLTCLDCLVPFTQIPLSQRIHIGIVTNILVVLKSLVDPVIYAARMPEIKDALGLMVSTRCGLLGDDNPGRGRTHGSGSVTLTSSIRMVSFRRGTRDSVLSQAGRSTPIKGSARMAPTSANSSIRRVPSGAV